LLRAVYFQEKSFLYACKCEQIKLTIHACKGSDISLQRQTERCPINLALSVNSTPLHSIKRAVLYPSYNEFRYTSGEVMKSFDSEFEIYLIMHSINIEGEEKMLPSGKWRRVFVFAYCCCQR